MTEHSSAENLIRAMIEHAERQSKIYKQVHNYKADWLVNGGIGSSEWVVSFPGVSAPYTLSFERLMPDGTMLDEEWNIAILQTIQKWLYHCRMGTITGQPMARNWWLAHYNFAMNLAARANLYQDIYKTSKYGFKLFDVDACKSLAEDLSRGGWPAALTLKERFIAHLLDVLAQPFSMEYLISEPDSLPYSFVSEAIAYFSKHDLYVKRSQASILETGVLSRDYIGSILGRHPASLSNPSFRLFIRQFEPDLINDHLLEQGVRRNPHNTQNTKKIEDVSKGQVAAKSFKTHMIILKAFFNGHDVLPEDIPEINLDINELILEYAQHLKPGGHTNLLPLEIGFKCLNEASKWIVVYGQAIVDSLIFYTEKFIAIDEQYANTSSLLNRKKLFQETKHLWMTNGMPNLPAEPLSQALNISELITKDKKRFPVDKSNYEMVMESFFGACAIVIGMVKPIRNAELSTLERNCLSTDTGNNGAFMRHMVGKTGALGVNDVIERPIPYVAAHAIQLLQVLGNSLAAIYGDKSKHANSLFYIPDRSFKLPRAKNPEVKVNRCIDTFCDAVKMPIDKLGRRWYVRVHEMRKFFLLLVHRHVGDLGKELLRYMAGHSNRENINSYIAYDMSDSEAIRYESECIDDKLIALEHGLLAEDQNQGLLALYTKALKDFKVTSIASINNQELLKYLDKAILNSDFDMTAYKVRLQTYEEEIYSIEFAIRVGNKKDANYNK